MGEKTPSETSPLESCQIRNPHAKTMSPVKPAMASNVYFSVCRARRTLTVIFRRYRSSRLPGNPGYDRDRKPLRRPSQDRLSPKPIDTSDASDRPLIIQEYSHSSTGLSNGGYGPSVERLKFVHVRLKLPDNWSLSLSAWR